ncbi:MAG: hypothetical protein JRH14_10800 [Deltaproteobacteria bacterium]|nr:hypothetical protein [Deltaproteobacteria bacterium]
MALDRLGALLEDAHVHLHDAETQDRSPFHLCFNLGDPDGAVDEREGQCRDREPPDEFRGVPPPGPPA